mgnify:CR=1 FL=1
MIRRLLLAPRGGIKRNRTSHLREDNVNTHLSEGAILGCTLANLLHHARGKIHKLCRAAAVVRAALVPAGAALRTCHGEDRMHLIRGLAAHRVLVQQAKRMTELKYAPRVDSRYGHEHTAVGATAAILAVFSVMALSAEDAARLDGHLEDCLNVVGIVLRTWRLSTSADDDSESSARAELRAVERALLGVRRARKVGSELGVRERFDLQLTFMRRAAWPAGEVVEESTHETLLARIASGEIVDTASDEGPCAPWVTPLSAVPALPLPNFACAGSSSSSSSFSAIGSDDPTAAQSRVAFEQSRTLGEMRLALNHGGLLFP